MYIAKKDMPNVKAGAKFILDEKTQTYKPYCPNGRFPETLVNKKANVFFTKEYVEISPEWFEEKNPFFDEDSVLKTKHEFKKEYYWVEKNNHLPKKLFSWVDYNPVSAIGFDETRYLKEAGSAEVLATHDYELKLVGNIGATVHIRNIKNIHAVDLKSIDGFAFNSATLDLTISSKEDCESLLQFLEVLKHCFDKK